MTTNDLFGRDLSAWLHDDAAGRVPDHLTEVLVRTAATRQRPWWSNPERWLPMIVTARTAPWLPAPRLVRIVAIAAIVLALVGLALFAAGSGHRLPTPFGPARNGVLAVSTSGQIYVLDSIDAAPRLLIAASTDFGPHFTRDGTHLTFLRGTCDAGGPALMIAKADGSSVRQLVQFTDCPSGVEVSPDGSEVTFAAAVGGGYGIYVLRTDGSDVPHRVVSGSMFIGWPMWRPPDGRELLYFQWDSDDLQLRGVEPNGGGQHLIKDIGLIDSGALDQLAPSLPPDGRFVVYAADDGGLLHNHVLDLESGADRELKLGPAGYHELHGVLSPDGTKLLFHDLDAAVSTIQEMVAPVDGSAPAIPIGPPWPVVDGSADLDQAFSPDGQTILINEARDKVTQIVDAATGGTGRRVGWNTDELPAWQRTGP